MDRFQASDEDMHMPHALARSQIGSGDGWISQKHAFRSLDHSSCAPQALELGQPQGEDSRSQAEICQLEYRVVRYTAKLKPI